MTVLNPDWLSSILRQRRWTGYRRSGASIPVSTERPSEGLCRVCFSPFADKKATAITGSGGPAVRIYKGSVFYPVFYGYYLIDAVRYTLSGLE